jgi:hypothetical protein
MPIPTRGFARIVAYVLLVSVVDKATALNEHVNHGRPHGSHPHGSHPRGRHAHARGRAGSPADASAGRAPALTGAVS